MSPKNSLLATGLTALGLFGLAPPGAADPAAAPSGTPTSVAPSPSQAVLLLTNGTVIRGLVSEDEKSYILHCKGGKIPYPRKLVEKSFPTIQEAYRYKVERLPERDPDEILKLAQWCLTNKLDAEAKVHLRAVLEFSPKNGQILAMLDKIEGAEARASNRDPEVVRSGVEVVDDRPEMLNPAVLGRAAREMGLTGLPQIPGLPTTVAVKRASEFAKGVHPVLQMYCARCHNDRYQGEFRLVSFKEKRDRTTDALRANLDATLRLIDQQDPAKSELLACTLRPHGTGSTKRPIFEGSNNRAYQVLSAWVGKLRPPPTPDELHPSRFGIREAPASGEERFAARRGGNVPLPLTPAPGARAQTSSADQEAPPPYGQILQPERDPGSRLPVDVYEASAHPNVPSGAEFPVPFAAGGPRPAQEPAAVAGRAGATAGRPPGTPQGGAPPQLPGGAPVPPEEGDRPPAPKAPRKPLKLDPTILQRALMNRNAPQ